VGQRLKVDMMYAGAYYADPYHPTSSKALK
jgi:hypothetical protein